MSNFHPLEVVSRGSETQLQVGGKLNKISRRVKNEIMGKTHPKTSI